MTPVSAVVKQAEAVVKQGTSLKEVAEKAKLVHCTTMGPLTIAESTFEKIVGEGKVQKTRLYHGWGWTRQSPKDKSNPALGQSVAIGRSRKALKCKLNGEPITSVFMG